MLVVQLMLRLIPFEPLRYGCHCLKMGNAKSAFHPPVGLFSWQLSGPEIRTKGILLRHFASRGYKSANTAFNKSTA